MLKFLAKGLSRYRGYRSWQRDYRDTGATSFERCSIYQRAEGESLKHHSNM